MHYATDALKCKQREARAASHLANDAAFVRIAINAHDLVAYFRLSPRDIRKVCADSRCAYLASYLYGTLPEPHTIEDVLYSQARILFRWRVAQVVGSRLTDVLCRRAAIRSYKKGMRRAVDRAKAEEMRLSNVVTAHGRAA